MDRPARLLRTRLLDPLLALLRQGLTPEKLALSVAVGASLGLFPIFGTTTLLCVLLSLALRLNQAAVQLVNYAMYPLYLPLLLAFVRLGETLAGARPVSLSIPLLAATLRSDPHALLLRMGTTGLHAVLGWAAIAPFLGAMLYAATLPALRRAARRLECRRQPSPPRPARFA